MVLESIPNDDHPLSPSDPSSDVLPPDEPRPPSGLIPPRQTSGPYEESELPPAPLPDYGNRDVKVDYGCSQRMVTAMKIKPAQLRPYYQSDQLKAKKAIETGNFEDRARDSFAVRFAYAVEHTPTALEKDASVMDDYRMAAFWTSINYIKSYCIDGAAAVVPYLAQSPVLARGQRVDFVNLAYGSLSLSRKMCTFSIYALSYFPDIIDRALEEFEETCGDK